MKRNNNNGIATVAIRDNIITNEKRKTPKLLCLIKNILLITSSHTHPEV